MSNAVYFQYLFFRILHICTEILVLYFPNTKIYSVFWCHFIYEILNIIDFSTAPSYCPVYYKGSGSFKKKVLSGLSFFLEILLLILYQQIKSFFILHTSRDL